MTQTTDKSAAVEKPLSQQVADEFQRMRDEVEGWKRRAITAETAHALGKEDRIVARQELATAKGLLAEARLWIREDVCNCAPGEIRCVRCRVEAFLAPAVEGPQPTQTEAEAEMHAFWENRSHPFVPCDPGCCSMVACAACSKLASNPIHAQTVRPADPNEPEYRKLYGKGIAPAPVRPAETPETVSGKATHDWRWEVSGVHRCARCQFRIPYRVYPGEHPLFMSECPQPSTEGAPASKDVPWPACQWIDGCTLPAFHDGQCVCPPAPAPVEAPRGEALRDHVLAAIDKYATTCHLDGPWDTDMSFEEVEQDTIKDVRSIVYSAFKSFLAPAPSPEAPTADEGPGRLTVEPTKVVR